MSQDSYLMLIKSKAREPMIYGYLTLLPWKEKKGSSRAAKNSFCRDRGEDTKEEF